MGCLGLSPPRLSPPHLALGVPRSPPRRRRSRWARRCRRCMSGRIAARRTLLQKKQGEERGEGQHPSCRDLPVPIPLLQGSPAPSQWAAAPRRGGHPPPHNHIVPTTVLCLQPRHSTSPSRPGTFLGRFKSHEAAVPAWLLPTSHAQQLHALIAHPPLPPSAPHSGSVSHLGVRGAAPPPALPPHALIINLT